MCKAFVVVVIVIEVSESGVTFQHNELGVTFQYILDWVSCSNTLSIESGVALIY